MKKHEVADEGVHLVGGGGSVSVVRPARERNMVDGSSARALVIFNGRTRDCVGTCGAGWLGVVRVEVPDLGEVSGKTRSTGAEVGGIHYADAEAGDNHLREPERRAVVRAHLFAHVSKDVSQDVQPVGKEDASIGGGVLQERHDDDLAARGTVHLISESVHVIEELWPLAGLGFVVRIFIASLRRHRVKKDVSASEVLNAAGNGNAKPVGALSGIEFI
jgi:hypothetical protein